MHVHSAGTRRAPFPGPPAQEPGDFTVIFCKVPALDINPMDGEIVGHRNPTRHEVRRHKFIRTQRIHHEV
jgi:hypothetical protein